MSLKDIFTLVRLPNLVMMAFTMYSCRLFVILPILRFSGSDTQLNGLIFFLVVVSVLLIAAGGYIMNDFYDLQIDRTNKPNEMIIGKKISPDKAYLWSHILSFTGVLVAFYLGFFENIRYIGMIHLGCSLSLWIYAAYLKRVPVAGNLLVSILCSVVILITAFYDPAGRQAEPILILLCGYAVFAFLLSLIREMIKDLEDLKGDVEAGCKTLPVMAGIAITKFIVSGLIVLTMAMLAYVQKFQFESRDFNSFAYIIFLIQIPLAFLIYRLNQSIDPAGYRFCSMLSKLIMVSGILSMPVFYLSFR